MNIYWKYLQYVVIHKFWVFVECCRFGLVWQGIIHDWHKLLPSEFEPYARHFKGNIQSGRDKTGYYKPEDTGDPAFDLAWFLHQKRSKHHWQSWIMPTEGGIGCKAFAMPERYWKEMIADWRGAGMAQTGSRDIMKWYATNRQKLLLHPDTRQAVERTIHF